MRVTPIDVQCVAHTDADLMVESWLTVQAATGQPINRTTGNHRIQSDQAKRIRQVLRQNWCASLAGGHNRAKRLRHDSRRSLLVVKQVLTTTGGFPPLS